MSDNILLQMFMRFIQVMYKEKRVKCVKGILLYNILLFEYTTIYLSHLWLNNLHYFHFIDIENNLPVII